jgi:polysaccharide export outer membrane protein
MAQPVDDRTSTLNREIEQRALVASARDPSADLYHVGPADLLEVSVFGADALSGTFRVDGQGRLPMPLLGPVDATGLTTAELEASLEKRLTEKYMKDPHVSIQVAEMQSHAVSVLGAVGQPGVYQIQGRKTLLEVLAMAQGLSPEAGGTIVVVRPRDRGAHAAAAPAPGASGAGMRADSTAVMAASTPGASPPLDGGGEAEGSVTEVDLNSLLDEGGMNRNLVVQAGDIIQVRPAGMVYVVGEVNRPGGFTVSPGEPMTALQAIALAQGLGRTAQAGSSMIVRPGPDGGRIEIPVDLDAVLGGDEPPPELQARDVLFVPNDETKAFGLGVVSALVRMVTFRGLIY